MEALLELTRYMADRLNEKQLPADGDPAFEQRIDCLLYTSRCV